jgi:hypothetical protein
MTTEFTWCYAHQHSPGIGRVVSRSSRTILQPWDGRIHVNLGQTCPGRFSEHFEDTMAPPYNPFSTSRISSLVGRTL